jgi:phosphoglycolate phosphatase-like HAD superfamily hydrolase
MLILFDIDGTLLLSHGASLRCYRLAALEIFGRELHSDGMKTAGGLDPLIWRELCSVNGIDGDEADRVHDRFRATYTRILGENLARSGEAYSLPGVPALLDALEQRQHATVGLLTGNYPETGRIKIEAAGLDFERFRVAAWGVDAGHRRGLLPVALNRHAAANGGMAPSPEQVVVVGDTPHDVDCAKANGARSLAVATGGYSHEQLSACEPDLLVHDLSGTESIAEWLAG